LMMMMMMMATAPMNDPVAVKPSLTDKT